MGNIFRKGKNNKKRRKEYYVGIRKDMYVSLFFTTIKYCLAQDEIVKIKKDYSKISQYKRQRVRRKHEKTMFEFMENLINKLVEEGVLHKDILR